MSLGILVLCPILFGCAYGLCLNQGSRDLEMLAPRSTRGMATGIFYIFPRSDRVSRANDCSGRTCRGQRSCPHDPFTHVTTP